MKGVWYVKEVYVNEVYNMCLSEILKYTCIHANSPLCTVLFGEKAEVTSSTILHSPVLRYKNFETDHDILLGEYRL